jgi:hypothetical protein
MNPTFSAATTKTASIATAFTRKLYRMLDVEDPAVIGWDASGLSFTIHDEEKLDDCVLPRYFRGRVDVFRQHLSEHGFRTTTAAVGSKQQESFAHEHFIRGEPNRLSLIVCVPTNKRRRSRLGKKRSTPGPASSVSTKCENSSKASPSSPDSYDFSFNVHSLQQAQDLSVQTSEADVLHDSLARILALHATNPVLSSKAMLDDQDGRPVNCSQIDTPLFSFEMMASMVEWLDTTA